jgi:hypothetical protein
VGGCASGEAGSSRDAADHTLRDATWPTDGSQDPTDGSQTTDGQNPQPDGTQNPDGSSLPDGTLPDAAVDAASDSAVPDGGPLDPNLELPDPAGDVCFTPGSMSECPGIQVCRFYDSVSGRCESCSPCGNLNDFCTASDQCDILFMCYMNRCTNFCQLGTMMCGAVQDCLDIGHPTHGVCNPF